MAASKLLGIINREGLKIIVILILYVTSTSCMASAKNTDLYTNQFSEYSIAERLKRLKSLIDSQANDYEQILSLYETLKDETYEAGWLVGSITWASAAELNYETRLKALKNSLHLYLRDRSGSDVFSLDKTAVGVAIYGFKYSLAFGDINSARHFFEIFKTEVLEGVLKEDPVVGEINKIFADLYEAQLQLETGNWNEASEKAKYNLEKLFSGPVIDAELGVRYEIFDNASAILRRDKQNYPYLLGQSEKFIKVSEIMGEEGEELKEIRIWAEQYALLLNDVGKADKFNQLSDKRLNSTTVEEWQNLFVRMAIENRFDLIDQGVDLWKFYFTKGNVNPRFESLAFIDTLISQAESSREYRYATKWREMVYELYVPSLVSRLRHGYMLTAKEKSDVAGFAFKFIKDQRVNRNKKFKLFQLIQNLSISRVTDMGKLSRDERKTLFIFQPYPKNSNFLVDAINGDINLVSEKEVQERLGDDQAVFAYLLSEEGLVIWSLTNRKANFSIVKIKASELISLKEKILSSIAATQFNDLASKTFFDIILKKQLMELPGEIEHLIFSLPPELSKMPMSLLVTERTTQLEEKEVYYKNQLERGFKIRSIPQNLGSPSWLIERYAISLIPSLRVKAAIRKSSGPKKFFGIGAPEFGSNQKQDQASLMGSSRGFGVFRVDQLHKNLVNLPNAIEELKFIASNFRESLLLTGKNANETNLKKLNLNKYDVISFATHGIRFDELINSREPSLVLTKDAHSDGLLTQSEIMDLDLSNTELTMLSACNTASSSGLENEGFTGLAAAFMSAGSKSVLVAHWSVVDKAAKEITTNIFKNKNELSYAKRLQSAMKILISSHEVEKRAPRYWAPFTLIANQY